MSQRQVELLRLRDLVDHITTSLDQLAWTDDPHSQHYLSESVLRNLESSRRVCMQLHRRAVLQVVN